MIKKFLLKFSQADKETTSAEMVEQSLPLDFNNNTEMVEQPLPLDFNSNAEMVEQPLLLNFDNNTEVKKQSSPSTDVSAALQKQPEQSLKQILNSSTFFIPLSSIVSDGYNKRCNGMNWPHHENMLKLFAIDFFIDGEPTQQQEKDKKDLIAAIVERGIPSRKRNKPFTVEEIISHHSGSYMDYGRDVIRAIAKNDIAQLEALNAQVSDAYYQENSIQLRKINRKARDIFNQLQSRYRGE